MLISNGISGGDRVYCGYSGWARQLIWSDLSATALPQTQLLHALLHTGFSSQEVLHMPLAIYLCGSGVCWNDNWLYQLLIGMWLLCSKFCLLFYSAIPEKFPHYSQALIQLFFCTKLPMAPASLIACLIRSCYLRQTEFYYCY